MVVIPPQNYTRALSLILNLCKEKKINTATLLVVNIHKQEMYLFQNLCFEKAYRISTSEKGVGQVENSEQTPLGLHTIKEKIGDREDSFTVFKSRKPLEDSFRENDSNRQIVGRILWLKGEEEGLNLGKNANGDVVDSFERYIYIHGTNQVSKIGTPSSGGCVCLLPDDIVDLYDRVKIGSAVYIGKAFLF